jgi:hypothetical protein
MKRAGLFVILLLTGALLCAEAPLTNWGDWHTVADYVSYRAHCLRFNKSAGHYVWEVEVKNDSNKDIHISIAVTGGERPASEVWDGNDISSGDSFVFPLMFADAGPGDQITVWWKNLRYE